MKNFMFKSMIIVLLIFIISFAIIESLIIIEGRKISTEKVDCVIVLGARLYGDMPSPALLERLKVAIKYLQNNKDIRVIVSGGQGPDEYVSEAYAMERYLMDNGIEGNRIIKEEKSTSTFENLKFSLNKFKKSNDKKNIKVMIVTNKYHIFRAKFLAKRFGVISYGLPAKIPPTIIIRSYIREYFAVIKSFFLDRV